MLVLTSLWIGPAASTVQDLVPPRLRATAAAAYLVVVTFVGLALGPYVVGRLSVATGSLRTGLVLALAADFVAAWLLWRGAGHIARDEAKSDASAA